MGKIIVEIETEKLTAVKAYLDEILKQMKSNRFLSIVSYKIKG